MGLLIGEVVLLCPATLRKVSQPSNQLMPWRIIFQLYHSGLTLHQQLKLKAAETDNAKPVLEDWQVYDKLRTSKKPNSTVPGDLPVKIINELSPELTKPVTKIYNKITKSGVYPRQWVIEYQTAFPKSNPPPY